MYLSCTRVARKAKKCYIYVGMNSDLTKQIPSVSDRSVKLKEAPSSPPSVAEEVISFDDALPAPVSIDATPTTPVKPKPVEKSIPSVKPNAPPTLPEKSATPKPVEKKPQAADSPFDTQPDKQPDKAPEKPAEVPTAKKAKPVQPPADQPVAQAVAVPAAPAKTETRKEIESILQDGLSDIYVRLTPAQQQEFTEKANETATIIEVLVTQFKATAREVLRLLRLWLSKVPGVNKYFVEQATKIKTDRIMFLQAQKKKQDRLIR